MALANEVLPSPASGREAGEEGSLYDFLAAASARLQQALHLDRREARLEARVLAARALGVERAWLIAHDRDVLGRSQIDAIEALIARRVAGEPVAYILGAKEFYGRTFKVTPDVLIPRPETELLVEAALERLPKDRPARVLDLGTGSGCIAISIALARPDCKVYGVDVDKPALAVAQDNARTLGVRGVDWLQSDWCEGLGTRKFDMIVSNPPYIAEQDIHLQQGDLRFEPDQALASGPDGLDAVRAIVAQASFRLFPLGWLLLEHGFDQSQACQAELQRAGFTGIETLSDLAWLGRVSLGQSRSSGI